VKRFISSLALFALALAGLAPSYTASAVGFEDGLPGQKSLDTEYDPNVGHWLEMDGGVQGRPYVTAFSVINPGEDPAVIVEPGNTNRAIFYDRPAGKLVIVIEPYNLCKENQNPDSDNCYATPNRMALTIGYSKGNNQVGYNFAAPTQSNGSSAQSLTDNSGNSITITEDTLFDVTLTLNTIGTQLRWAQMYGHPEFWQPSNLGLDDATVRFQMRPAISDVLTTNMDQSCWQISPREGDSTCPVDAPDESPLRANIMFSLEEGYGEDLTGAVFGVSRALSGEFCNGIYAPTTDGSNPYCRKEASPINPIMEFQMIGFHYQKGHSGNDNFLNEGTLEAFLPASMLMNTYGLLPEDAATAFSVSRAQKGNWADSKGTFDPPQFDLWTERTNGSDGLMLTVTGVTYSAPKFTVKRKAKPMKVRYTRSGSIATFKTTLNTCSKSKPCVVSIYELAAELYDPSLSEPVVIKTVKKSAIKVSTAAGIAAEGDRFLIAVTRKNGVLVNSTTVD
jgi:hypothetical protein